LPHPTAWQDPQVDLEAKELSGLIRLLPSGYQTVFNLFAIEGYAHAEIARLLGIREVTSRSQNMRARTALAGLVESHHSPQPKADCHGK
jgi:RNA polymerase sigma-70 factor (ECF subfamily)